MRLKSGAIAMSDSNNLWVWFVEDVPLRALLRVEAGAPHMHLRAACSPVLAHAISLRIEGRNAEALAELKEAAASGNQPCDVHSALGQFLFEAGRTVEAAAQFAAQAILEPTSATAHYNNAVCLVKLGEWKESAAAFDRSAAASPDRLESWLGLGVSQLHNADAQSAAAAFAKALDLSPDDAVAVHGRAVALQMLGRSGTALTESSPDAGRAFEVGCERYESGSHQTAADAFESALRARPKWLAAQSNLALSYWKMGKHDLALIALEPALADGQSLTFGVAIALDMPDCLRAAAILLQLDESDPDFVSLSYRTAAALDAAGSHGEAASVYRRIVCGHPEQVEALVNLGHALSAQGQADEAQELWERALALQPELALES